MPVSTEDILNPQSSYYEENPLYLRPGEEFDVYSQRTSPLLASTSDQFRDELSSTILPSPQQPFGYDSTKYEIDPNNPGRLRRIGTETAPGSGDPEMGGALPKKPVDTSGFTPQQLSEYNLNQQAQADIDWFKNTTQQLVQSMDAATAALVQNINLEYDRLVSSTRQLNQQIEGATRVVGIRQGRTRYAPEIQEGVMLKTVNEGLQRIQDLESRRVAAVNQAQTAKSEKQYALLFESMKEIRQTKKDRDQAIMDLHKKVLDEERNTIEKAKLVQEQIKNDQAIMEKAVKSLGYIALSSMTGDKEADSKKIRDIARQRKIDPDYLLSEVTKLDSEGEKYGPGDIGLYQFYRSLPADEQKMFLQFQKDTEKVTGKSETEVLSVSDAKALGVPFGTTRAEAFGKKPVRQLGETEIRDFSQARLAKENAERIAELIAQIGTQDPVVGRFRKANPYDTKVVELQNLITQMVPGLARGIFKEVGVLTETDIALYTQTIANPTLTKEQADNATKQLLKTINLSIALQLDTLKRANKDVEDFEDILRESEREIALSDLADQKGFSLEEARRLGYDDDEIREFLLSQ